MGGDEHQRHARPDDDRELGEPDRDPERDLAPRRAEPAAARAGDVRGGDRGRAEDEQQQDGQRGVAPGVDDADQRTGGERGGEHEQRGAERPAHGMYRYPTPHTVCTCFGCAGSASIFARRRRTWTVTVEVSE